MIYNEYYNGYIEQINDAIKTAFIIIWHMPCVCSKINFIIEHKEIKAGLDGLSPIKDQYETEEKKLIAGAANKYGARTVAQAYGLKWQTVVAWKKHYGDKAAMAALKNGTKKSAVKIIIQSPAGQEVTIDELLERVGKSAGASGANETTEATVDIVYIRADEGKAYWVRETENGAVELW